MADEDYCTYLDEEHPCVGISVVLVLLLRDRGNCWLWFFAAGVLFSQHPSHSFAFYPAIMARLRGLYVLLSILGLFLLGTVVVLSSVSYYLAIDNAAYLTNLEVPTLDNVTRWNATDHGQVERIPRILHQTWKSETLPERWTEISQACRDMMPD